MGTLPERIDFAVLSRMLTRAATAVEERREHFSTLDAATGDGDHGAAMAKVAKAVSSTVAAAGDPALDGLLQAVAWAVMGTDAGSTGPLYGSLFLGMGEGVGDAAELDGGGLADMIEAGVARLRQHTKAMPGDKTMIDALLPAATALRASADAGDGIAKGLEAAAAAATEGAESTKDMRAAFGRARNIGERSVGHVDPGAASMAVLFEGLKEGYTDA